MAAAAEPWEEQVRSLVEATGAAPEACLAALNACGGSAEEAAAQLLGLSGGEEGAEEGSEAEESHRSGAPVVSANVAASVSPAGAEESGLPSDAQVTRLMEATGRSLHECRTALVAHSHNIDAAAGYLLLLPEGPTRSLDEVGMADRFHAEATAIREVSEITREAELHLSSATSAGGARQCEEEELDPGEAMMAAHVAEVTGHSFGECRRALDSYNGLADAAVVSLLGLAQAADAAEADEQSGLCMSTVEVGLPRAGPNASIVDFLGSSQGQIGSDPFAGVDATEVNAGLLMGQHATLESYDAADETSEDIAIPSPKRRRASQEEFGTIDE